MKQSKSFLIWLVALLVLSMFMGGINNAGQRAGSEKLAFSDFMNLAESKKVSEVLIEGPDISGTLSDGKKFYSYSPYDPTMVETLRQNGVKVEARPQDTSSSTFWSVFVSWFPNELWKIARKAD